VLQPGTLELNCCAAHWTVVGDSHRRGPRERQRKRTLNSDILTQCRCHATAAALTTHLLDAQLGLPQPLQRPHRLLLQLTWGSSPSAVPKHAPSYDIIACFEVPLTQAIYSRPHMDLDAPEARMDFLSAEDSGRRGMLDEAIFPAFGNDAGSPSAESPEQMKKNDPLGTQIWKLYSRAKTQLPNAERMENLTWRMMAMNMRRAELDRNRGYEFPPCPSCWPRLRAVRLSVHLLTGALV
jgi:hypothetical protein